MIVWKMNNWPTAEQTAMMPMCGRIDGLALRKVTTGTISSVTSRPVCEGRGIRSVGAGPGRDGLEGVGCCAGWSWAVWERA